VGGVTLVGVLEDLMPIGRFARACRLSVKALRHYDALGLLAPAFVDPDSGYRYYGREQVRPAVAIALLRSLDVPLPAIRELLDAGDVARIVTGERRRLEQEIERRRGALRTLERILGSGELFPYEVHVVDEPRRRVARLVREARPGRLVEDSTALVAELVALAARLRWSWGDPIIGLYPPELREPCPVAACVTLADEPDEAGGAELVDLEGGPMAGLTHVGPYEELPLSYFALFAWAQERGHELGGPVREIYVNDPQQVDVSMLTTHVMIPIERTEK
jgi:DNA-binding transcriptional MerR regulator